MQINAKEMLNLPQHTDRISQNEMKHRYCKKPY